MKPIIVKAIKEGAAGKNSKQIKMTRIDIRKPRWDPHPEKSKTKNWNWRQGLFPIFDNGKYDWMPLFKEISQMNALLNKKKQCFIVFETRFEPKNEYFWCPTNQEIVILNKKKHEIDKINSILAQKMIKNEEKLQKLNDF